MFPYLILRLIINVVLLDVISRPVHSQDTDPDRFNHEQLQHTIEYTLLAQF